MPLGCSAVDIPARKDNSKITIGRRDDDNVE